MIARIDLSGIELVDETALSDEERAVRKAEMDLFAKEVREGDPMQALFAMIHRRQARYPAEVADEIRDNILSIYARALSQRIVRQAEFSAELYNAATSANGDFFEMFSRISAMLKEREVTALVVLGLIACGTGENAAKVKKAIDEHISERARHAASVANAENHAMREDAERWLDDHFVQDKLTNSKAAEQLKNVVPVEYDTRLRYVKLWKKSRAARAFKG